MLSLRKASVLMIHNEYGALSGEEVQFGNIVALLRSQNHPVEVLTRKSSELHGRFWGPVKGFFTGIYNPSSIRSVLDRIELVKPDLVFFQNLYPLISPSILPAIRSKGIPIIMLVANYRLMCPNGLHFSRGEVCERCLQGREWWCVLRNCECRPLKSLGYAIRNWAARTQRLFQQNVDVFLCASNFLKQRMIDAGFEASRIFVNPNIIECPTEQGTERNLNDGEYIGYVGRLSREKGIDTLLDIARMCPQIEFRLAGQESMDFCMPKPLPPNVKIIGFLKGDALEDFYHKSRIMISTSKCFETFGMSIAEAMIRGIPVVVPRHGVFPSFVIDGETGLVADVGQPITYVRAIHAIWYDTDLCSRLASAGQAWALKMYSPETYYTMLSNVFDLLSRKCSPPNR